MRTFLMAFALLVVTPLFAWEPELVCSGKMSERSERRCHDLITTADYFDSNALLVCAMILDVSPKLHCLRTTRNHYFDRGALEVCKLSARASDRIRCLDVIKDKSFDPVSTDQCRRMVLPYFATNQARVNCVDQLPFEESPALR